MPPALAFSLILAMRASRVLSHYCRVEVGCLKIRVCGAAPGPTPPLPEGYPPALGPTGPRTQRAQHHSGTVDQRGTAAGPPAGLGALHNEGVVRIPLLGSRRRPQGFSVGPAGPLRSGHGVRVTGFYGVAAVYEVYAGEGVPQAG